MTERGAVLLIEDDDGLRTIVARHLRGLGFVVAEAASAENATTVIGEARPGRCRDP